jgi:predicted membrane channel-forming protein YqfA (hemolysin III family)
LNAAIYANSLVGVGIASGLYHSSKGEVRKILRWADYTMIATTTLVSHIFHQAVVVK